MAITQGIPNPYNKKSCYLKANIQQVLYLAAQKFLARPYIFLKKNTLFALLYKEIKSIK